MSTETAVDHCTQERQSLLSKLLDSVKQCQIRFGGRTELATENDSRVICLCAQFENVLQHGVRKNSKNKQRLKPVTEVMKGLNLMNGDSEFVFWQIIKTVLNKHEFERYMLLKSIHTDIGRGRAWLRSSLNERSLERYIHMLLADTNQISQYYEDWAFLMDQERSSMLPMMAAGLGSILFAINIDNPDLNSFKSSNLETTPDCSKSKNTQDDFEPQPVIAKAVMNGTNKHAKKKKWPATQVISFDENDGCQSSCRSQTHPGCYSAPATCLSSPVSTVGNFSAFQSVQPQSGSTASVCDISVSGKVDEAVIASDNTAPTVSVLGSDLEEQSISEVSEPPADSTVTISEPTDIPATLGHLSSDFVERKTPLATSSASSSTSLTVSENCIPQPTTLTPVNNTSVGELIPVNHIEDISSSANRRNKCYTADSLSIPSYCEDVDSAVAALEIAQRVHSWSLSSTNSLNSRRESQSKSRSETLTMTAEELREAILVVLQKKEDTEEKNRYLRSMLDREMEMTAGLRAESEETQKHHNEKVEKLEARIQTITRENELLKHQLRKYISAVQMLKHDSSKISELTAVVGEIQPPIPEPRIFIDHQHEANEYEKKLVQVAEMHGELMEFNDRLHRVLLQREVTIRRLREELIDLRGPLPDDNHTSDDDLSITSDYDASSQTTPLRPLINVWIPSAFLTGHTANSHHVYQVYVRIRDDEWNVYRRYAQFYALHKTLKKKDPILNTFDFPPKKTIGKKDAKVVEQRRRRLQHYLRCVLNWLLQINVELSNSPDKETFISLMPFFSDQTPVAKKPEVIGGNRLRLPGRTNTAPTTDPQPVQRYTGL